MVKKLIGFKLEDSEIQDLKTKAGSLNLNTTDFLRESLRNFDQNLFLQEQITDLQKQIKDLETKTNHKIKDKQYISIPVSRSEKEKIRKLAFDNRTSQGMFVRDLLSKSGVNVIKQLT